MEVKQVIIIRGDLKMSKGKIASQAAHASVLATLKSNKKLVEKWENQGMTKIVLKADTLESLKGLLRKANDKEIVTSEVVDDGLTEVNKDTITCGAIGPGEKSKVDNLTKTLKLFH